jgi:hypothetical protein
VGEYSGKPVDRQSRVTPTEAAERSRWRRFVALLDPVQSGHRLPRRIRAWIVTHRLQNRPRLYGRIMTSPALT